MAPNEDLPRSGKVAWPEEPIIDGSLRTMPRNDYLREFGPVIDHLGLGNGAWFNPVINGQAFSPKRRPVTMAELLELKVARR